MRKLQSDISIKSVSPFILIKTMLKTNK